MKNAKDILYEHATKNNDGFMAGQVKWVVEAMEYFAEQQVDDACRRIYDQVDGQCGDEYGILKFIKNLNR